MDLSGKRDIVERGRDPKEVTYENIDITQGDSLAQEISAFLAAVRSRQKPEVSGEAGRNALKVALEIIEQIKSTQPSLT